MKHKPDWEGFGHAMTYGKITLTPVGDPIVSGIMCECGVCGAFLEFDYMELHQETGMIDGEEMFGECPDCGGGYDASAVVFSAYLKATP